jgi:hypothetical protein
MPALNALNELMKFKTGPIAEGCHEHHLSRQH